jgi:hypothetical protein
MWALLVGAMIPDECLRLKIGGWDRERLREPKGKAGIREGFL